ncbi:O-antigen ligase family protein [Streptomyces sp. NPDC060194]|uniref:O-antigen ligase family protein n=1 Tax=Streptomyces sp. NPDC060194 TaxID=3347069 RepID=UPI0036583568
MAAAVLDEARPARGAAPAPAAGPGARPWRRLAPYAHLAPLLAVIALLMAPADASGGGTPADAASGVLVLYCAVRLLRRRERPLTAVGALVVGLPVTGIALACVTSADPAASLPGVGRYLQVFVLVPLAVLLVVRDRRDFAVAAWALVALALGQGAVGVAQFLTGTGASYMGQDIRAVGTFGPSDVMGMATVVSYGLVVCVALALGLGPGPAGVRTRQAAVVFGALLVVPLVLSFSRGAWIATVAACLLQVVLSGGRRALRVLATVSALGVVLVLGFGVGSAMLKERVSSITQVTGAPDRSVTDRYTMWAAAVEMWRAEPVTGVGLKGFPEYRDSNASLALSAGSDTAGAGQGYKKQALLSPHNMYLLVLGEQGALGLVTLLGSWLALLALGLRRLAGAARTGGATWCGLLAVGLLARQLVDFAYADIGGPSTVLTSVMFGLAAWWALAADGGPRGGAIRAGADLPGPALVGAARGGADRAGALRGGGTEGGHGARG